MVRQNCSVNQPRRLPQGEETPTKFVSFPLSWAGSFRYVLILQATCALQVVVWTEKVRYDVSRWIQGNNYGPENFPIALFMRWLLPRIKERLLWGDTMECFAG